MKVPSSFRRYCIAGNFREVQNFAFFADREVCAKIKTHENLNSGVNMTSLLEMRMRGAGGGLEIDDQLCSRWIEIAMALYRYFQPVDSISDTKGPLSTHPPR